MLHIKCRVWKVKWCNVRKPVHPRIYSLSFILMISITNCFSLQVCNFGRISKEFSLSVRKSCNMCYCICFVSFWLWNGLLFIGKIDNTIFNRVHNPLLAICVSIIDQYWMPGLRKASYICDKKMYLFKSDTLTVWYLVPLFFIKLDNQSWILVGYYRVVLHLFAHVLQGTFLLVIHLLPL